MLRVLQTCCRTDLCLQWKAKAHFVHNIWIAAKLQANANSKSQL